VAAAPPHLSLADRARRAALLGHRIAEPGGAQPTGALQRRSDPPLTQSEPGDPFELQAEEVAGRIADGRPAGDLLAPPASGPPPGLSANKKKRKARASDEDEERIPTKKGRGGGDGGGGAAAEAVDVGAADEGAASPSPRPRSAVRSRGDAAAAAALAAAAATGAGDGPPAAARPASKRSRAKQKTRGGGGGGGGGGGEEDAESREAKRVGRDRAKKKAARVEEDSGDEAAAAGPEEARGLTAEEAFSQLNSIQQLDLAEERLEDFSANLQNVSKKVVKAMKVINPDRAADLEEKLREGKTIGRQAPIEYRDLRAQIEATWNERLGDPDLVLARSGNARDLARPIDEAFLSRVEAAINRYEIPMQEIQTLFASAPPSKKFPDFKGNPLRPDLYHTGESTDPIPFVWYKSPGSYKAFDTDDDTYKFPEGPQIALLGNQQLTAEAVPIGKELPNVGSNKEARGDAVPKVRKDLTRLGANLRGLDIDHVHDLGFGGADKPHNMWPLDADVNRRPVLGWRSHYGLNYKIKGKKGKKPELKTAAINDLVDKWFVVKSFMAPDDAQAVPEEGREPMRKSGVATADEGKV
jgi:hypothetical protein